MHKIYDEKKIKSYRSYTIDDLCRVYKDKKLHPQTIRKWIREGHFEVMKNGKTILIYGAVFKEFLHKNNNKYRVKLKPKEFWCGSCQKVVLSLDNQIMKLEISSAHNLLAYGKCSCCGRKIRRIFKKEDYRKILYNFNVLDNGVGTLGDSFNETHMTHKTSEPKTTPSEFNSQKPDYQFYRINDNPTNNNQTELF